MQPTNTFMPKLPDPIALADQTSNEIMQTLKSELETESMLSALQNHYDTLHKSQEMYIDYLTEFIQKLKGAQQKDKESLTNLKKEVLRHILDIEKTKKRD